MGMIFEENETLDSARRRNVRDALYEDLGRCDWTAQLVPADKTLSAELVAREEAVLCGRPWFDDCFRFLDESLKIRWDFEEGAVVSPGTVLCRLSGGGRAILSGERPAMNFLQLLSGVATVTRTYVDAIRGLSPNPSGCAILDTRKTVPGLRQAQKYAVRTGGGMNHRLGLWDGILIKENHILAAGGIAGALRSAKGLRSGVQIQIEVENLDELDEALAAGAKNILLDNFSLDDMHRAFGINAGRAVLEASGGVDLQTVRDIAKTGVDRISVGKLTKDVGAIDLSLRVRDG
jgi:nicotinate-nucleotide pyrophosphorylase (carboxylating)